MQHCRIWKRHARLKITQFINSKLPSLVYELARPFTAHRLSPTPGYQCWGKQIFTLSRLAMNRTLKEWWSEQWTNHRIVKIATNCLSKLHSRSKFPSKMKGCCKKGWPAGSYNTWGSYNIIRVHMISSLMGRFHIFSLFDIPWLKACDKFGAIPSDQSNLIEFNSFKFYLQFNEKLNQIFTLSKLAVNRTVRKWWSRSQYQGLQLLHVNEKHGIWEVRT